MRLTIAIKQHRIVCRLGIVNMCYRCWNILLSYTRHLYCIN